MLRRTAVWTLLAAVAVPVSLLAHEGHEHVIGTVTAVDAKHVEVQRHGKKVSVNLRPDTKFIKTEAAQSAAKVEDVKVGARVVIDAESKDGNLEALEVRIGSARPSPGPATSPKPGAVPE